MAISRWGPFREMMTLRQAMDRLFEDAFIRPPRALAGEEAAQFPIDIYHTPEAVVVRASLPGVEPENVDISITGDTLTINGEVKVREEIKREDYLLQEQRYGSFRRSLTLPAQLQTEKAEAKFSNGMLTLTIPKIEEVKPKVIKVKI